jgi:glycosyltransferase involved in cell wall biosynthesis
LTSNYPRWPGDTTTPFIHQLAVDLASRDWDVTVLAPHAAGAAHRETLEGITIRRFRYFVPERAQTVCYGGGALVNIRESRLTTAKLPALVLSEWAATTRALASRVDVLHAHWTLPQGFVAVTTPFRRIPRVLTVHGGDVFGLRGGILDRFSAFALRRSDEVTVNSLATEEAVREIAGSHIRVSQVPIGVDLSRTPRPELVRAVRDRYRTQDGPLLVFVGRIVEEKGVEDVVHAAALLTADFPGISAVIAGAGQHAERVRVLAAELGLAERVHLPGWLDSADVPSWFAAADVVLAPSRIGRDGWTEGQGLSIIEAMASGRPVVATRTGGIPETITDGQTGLLVRPSDPAAVAGAVRLLVESPELASAIARRGSDSVRTRFDRSVTAGRFDGIYRAQLESRRTGHRKVD